MLLGKKIKRIDLNQIHYQSLTKCYYDIILLQGNVSSKPLVWIEQLFHRRREETVNLQLCYVSSITARCN